MTYEYGYTLHADGKVKEVVLQEFPEEDLEKHKKGVAYANKVEQGPNIRGLIRPQTSFWWIREKK